MITITPFLVEAPTFYHFTVAISRFATLEADDVGEIIRELIQTLCMTAPNYLLQNDGSSSSWNTITGAKLFFPICNLFLARSLWKKHIRGNGHMQVSCTGKCFIITGSNTGLGYETAKSLLKMGATVVMACRSLPRAHEAREKLLQETKVDPSKLIVLSCDLCDLQSIRKFVEEFTKLGLPLDCLINNAGLMSNERILTKDGYEMTFMANHLGHFLLTLLLLPFLQQSKEGRILNLTSCLHKLIKTFQFEDQMTFPHNYEMFHVYGQSKLCNILFTKALATRCEKDQRFKDIRVYAIHPGCVQTEVTRGINWWLHQAYQGASPMLGLFLKTAEQGAAGIVQIAIDPSLSSASPSSVDWKGEYFFHGQRSPVTELAKDREVAERLWQISEQWAEIKWEDVLTSIHK